MQPHDVSRGACMNEASSRVWASLSAYESTELVKRFAKARTGREPNSTQAREIAAHFSQGREYFRRAAGAGELVRPLILYYGALALAGGAVLFLDQKKSRAIIGHGLQAAGWKNLSADPAAVPDLPVEVTSRGVLPGLAHATGNVEWAQVRTERMPGLAEVWSPGTALRAGVSLTIKELLGQVPDIAELYEKTFTEHSRRLRCEVLITHLPEPGVALEEEIPPDREMRRHAWLGIIPTPNGLPQPDWVMATVGNGRLHYRGTDTFLHFARDPNNMVAGGHRFDLYYDAGSLDNPRLEAPLTISASGEEYLKLPTDEGILLSTLLALHMASFAMSRLVRYHPGFWAAVIGRTKGDSIAPVLSACASVIEERYPALILEAIGG
jgi:hypothetical protein